jgi:hemin uptake protein HemP
MGHPILRASQGGVDTANANGYRFRMITTEPSAARDERGGAAPAGPQAPGKRVHSAELLGERGELIIVHAGREYRLRLTQSGKLILTA